MEGFRNGEGKDIVLKIVKAIRDNKDYLSEVDGAIGDGDHGINMNKGFTMSGERITEGVYSFTGALEVLGDVLISEIGGSMGPIYGTLFMDMADYAEDAETIDKDTFAGMLHAALEGLMDLVDARQGDKTLMDVIIPAEQAYKDAVEGGKAFGEALDAMAIAAEKGRDSTKELVAKFGRASRLGERSKGVLDAGSVSCTLVLEAMAAGIKEKL